MEKLRVEYVPIGAVKEYENNAKRHPEEQIQQIKESIKQFGNCDPIAVWHDPQKNADVIVEGHGRLRALLEMGATEVPVIHLDHLTDEQRRAYTLIHNKLTMNSDFDSDVLLSELDDITNIDMKDFGFELPTDNGSYIDSFFDRGVEAKESTATFGCKVIVNSQADQDEVIKFLKDNGYEAKPL